jgi:hypothetical protein
VAGEDSVRAAQVWKDGGRVVVLAWRRGPQYVHEEGLSTFRLVVGVQSVMRLSAEPPPSATADKDGMKA